MKLWEINLDINTGYKIAFGVNRFNVICKDGDLYKETSTGLGLKKLTDEYSLDFIVNNCEFEILWDKIERDTKVLCASNGLVRRHFKEVCKVTKKIKVYPDGKTSFTTTCDLHFELYDKKDVILYKED